ncbi:hypothetical protein ML462_14045 [Gramella lutea]|uniref:Lipoprotein n=1 Tax=Christiangramia lutea TaxID=1607951 RepID=A0A9X2ACP2_9FLAO|nr:hypothetical protein [Christiangramia lutea]MCH4824293.1 hypothetical protein [Christiangramia lutea]
MKYFFILLLVISLYGCGSQRRPITNTVSTLDSTYVDSRIRLRDTVIKVPFQKVSISADQQDLTEKPITKSNGKANVSLFKKDNVIYANAECDSLELQLKLKDSIISTFRQVKTDTTITLPPERIKYIPWIVKILAWIGGLSLLYFGWKLFRFIQSFSNPISFLR